MSQVIYRNGYSAGYALGFPPPQPPPRPGGGNGGGNGNGNGGGGGGGGNGGGNGNGNNNNNNGGNGNGGGSNPAATPVVRSTSSGGSAATTAQVISMPSGIVAGDGILVLFANDGAPPTSITGANWMNIAQANNTGDVCCLTAYFKIAEGSDSLTVNMASDECEYVAYRISGAGGCTAQWLVSAAKDMPTCTPIEGSANYLWVCGWGMPGNQDVSSAPTGYTTNLTNVSVAGGGVSLAASYRANTAASENPGAFTTSGGAGTDSMMVLAIPPIAEIADPLYSSVISLNNWPGTDGSTTIVDAKGKTWIANGAIQLDTGVKFFGQPTLLSDGTGDYLQTAHHADWNLAPSAFTIESWVRPTGDNALGIIIAKWEAGKEAWILARNDAGADNTAFYFFQSNSGNFDARGPVLPLNVWSFVSIAYPGTGSAIYLHVNGVRSALGYTGNSFDVETSVVTIGALNYGPTNCFVGNLGPIRVTLDDRYGLADYAPPARPFATS